MALQGEPLDPRPAANEAGPEDAQIWARFAGAAGAREFCTGWLSILCRAAPGTLGGLLLMEDSAGAYAPAAIWPDPERDLSRMGEVAKRALVRRQGVVLRHGDEAGTPGIGAHVAYPVDIKGRIFAIVVIETRSRSDAELQAALRQMHWGAGWIETLFQRRQAEQNQTALDRARFALDVAGIAAGARGLRPLCLAVASDLAVRLGCRRVSIGLVSQGRIRLKALSHTAWFARSSALTATLRGVMEEAYDQAATVSHPMAAKPGQGQAIAIAHAAHARETGMAAVVSVPVLDAGKVLAVITLEIDEPAVDVAEVTARTVAAAELLAPVLALEKSADGWLGGRVFRSLQHGITTLFGPRHLFAKLCAVLVVAAAAWLTLATGEWRISAKASLEGRIHRAAVAPFDGFIAGAPVRAGETVAAGQVLATLDDRELQLEAARWESQRDQARIKQRDADGRHEPAEAAVFAANAQEAEAQLALVNQKLAQVQILAPFSGVVVSGDLRKMLGAPVERGKLLFEIAPLDSYRVIINVDERDIRPLAPGQQGTLLLSGLSDRPLRFTVGTTPPVARSDGQGQNIFAVEATLDGEDQVTLRPGMEGVAKITVGSDRLVAIWTYRLWDWLRLAWWKVML